MLTNLRVFDTMGLVFQPDGKLVAAAAGIVGIGYRGFGLARYNPDGTLDGTFGTGGIVITPIGTADDWARALVLQPDGKLVAAGISENGVTPNFALARYNADGTLDGSFGTGGTVETPIGTSEGSAYALALQPDGKLVAAGWLDDHFGQVRYNADGTLDGTFGTGGAVMTPIERSFDSAFALVIQPDGRRVAAGMFFAGFYFRPALARYLADACPPGSGEPDGDGDDVCDAADNCPDAPNFGQDNGDGDAFGDVCDPCIGGAGGSKHKVTLSRILAPANDDSLKLTAQGKLATPVVPPLDPPTNGVRLFVTDGLGAMVVDAIVPGSAYDPVTRTGWITSGAGTAWTYKNPGTHPQGIAQVGERRATRPASSR